MAIRRAPLTPCSNQVPTKTTSASLTERLLARLLALLPAVELAHVLETVERSDAMLRVLLKLEHAELGQAIHAAVVAEDAAARADGRAADHRAALAAAERRVAAEWRLVWGDPPGVQEPRRAGAWAELRAAHVTHDLEIRAGGDGVDAGRASRPPRMPSCGCPRRRASSPANSSYPVEHPRG